MATARILIWRQDNDFQPSWLERAEDPINGLSLSDKQKTGEIANYERLLFWLDRSLYVILHAWIRNSMRPGLIKKNFHTN